MKKWFRTFTVILVLCLVLGACSSGKHNGEAHVKAFAEIDSGSWLYNASDDVYYQTGLVYCKKPADKRIENLGIFVPGAYFDAQENGGGTYTCTPQSGKEIGGFTAETAPIVLPVNTPGYAAMAAPSGYDEASRAYTSNGFVYLAVGCRGRDFGAPSGVTDLKAAIRYIRSNAERLAGNTERIFPFGMSGGGAQSVVLGVTGDDPLYAPYLEAIGAVSDASDAVAGVMSWCPVTSLDTANWAYEWNMGTTRNGLTAEEQALSDELAFIYENYVNSLQLKDEKGNALTIDMPANEKADINLETVALNDKPVRKGPYYDYVKAVIEKSLERFLKNTKFPYQSFETPEAYVASLNSTEKWVSYNADDGSVVIASVEDFTERFKKAEKGLCAYDALDKSAPENVLFGLGDSKAAHFDTVLYHIVDEKYRSGFEKDLSKPDEVGNISYQRVNLYSPLYYLCDYHDGKGTTKVADYWRIRTGINQTDAPLTTEINLALALAENGKQVDFETVWGQGHTEAESSGNAKDNFIRWVKDCLR